MAINLRKTLVVGLGGTGIKSILHMKQELQNQLGQIPKVIQIRCFDTTTGTKEHDRPLAGDHGNQVQLEGTEFYYAHLRGVRNAIDRALESKNSDLKKWLPRGKISLDDIIDGAGQQRSSGRLALFAKADEILGSLKQAYGIVRGFDVAQMLEQDKAFGIVQGEVVNAYIICSLAGGTGAGMFLDIAYFLRSIMNENDNIMGIFVLPTIFEGLTAAWRPYILGNTYASLKELDYWMSASGRGEPLQYSRSQQITWGGQAPYTHIFLIDAENEKAEVINEREDLWRFLGRSLALTITAESLQQDILDSLKNATKGDPWLGGKYAKYMGLGLSTLDIPLLDISELGQSEVTLELIRDGLLTSPKKAEVDQEVNRFIVKKSLQPDQILGQLIPEAKEMPDEVEIHPLPLPRGSAAEIVESVLTWKRDLMGKVGDGFEHEAENHRQVAQARIQGEISARVQQELKNKGGVDFSYHFLATLAEHLSNCIQDWRKGRKQQEEERAKEVNYPSDERIKDAARRFFRGPLTSVINDFATEMRKEAGYIREIKRREHAEQLFAAVLGYVEDYQNHIRDLMVTLKNAIKTVIHEIHDQDEKLGKADVFTTRLGKEYVADDLQEIRDRIDIKQHVLKHLNGDTLLAWRDLKPEEIVSRIKAFIVGEFSTLEQLTLGKVLESMNKQDHRKVIGDLRKFVGRAVPFWRIEEDWAEGDIGQSLVFGVPEGDQAQVLRTAIQQGDIDLAAFADRAFATISNKHRYDALMCKSALPAYSLSKIFKYWQDYQKREGKRSDFTHHIHKDWPDLPEPIPSQLLRGVTQEQLDERLQIWTVAQAKPFELIKKEGLYYKVRSRQKGEAKTGYWVQLAKSRVGAWETFSNEEFTEVFEEVRDEVDKIMAKEGNRAVLAGLQEYLKVLRDWEPTGEERKKLIQAEYDALLKFINGLIDEEPTLREVLEEETLSMIGTR